MKRAILLVAVTLALTCLVSACLIPPGGAPHPGRGSIGLPLPRP